jgi:hypothetical protein
VDVNTNLVALHTHDLIQNVENQDAVFDLAEIIRLMSGIVFIDENNL